MLHPIQRIHSCTAGTPRVYTATSNVLHAFNAITGELLTSWTAPIVPTQGPKEIVADSIAGEANDEDGVEGDSAPQAKKRKVEEASGSPAPSEMPPKKGKGGVRRSRLTATEGGSNNAIVSLTTTSDGKNLVVATSEDKSIRVFVAGNQKLELLSTRSLPKRVSGLALLDDETTLVAADKHGDVFTMPLLGAETQTTGGPVDPAGSDQLPAGPKRDEEAAKKRARTEIDYNLPYEHKFIIGHVSMLLNVCTVGLPADHPKAQGKKKTVVITADRDEHIRVTRYPQTFMIHRFLLGHEAFVAKLLTPSWNLTGLISGGGDNYLLVWDWMSGEKIQQIELVDIVQNVLRSSAPKNDPDTTAVDTKKSTADSSDEFRTAVTGIWELPNPNVKAIMVGVEKVPALFIFAEEPDGLLKYTSHIPLPGNLLDVAVIGPENKILTSVHPSKGQTAFLGAYEFDDSGVWSEVEHPVVKSIENDVTTVNVPEHLEQAVIANVLYTVEQLRKEFPKEGHRNVGPLEGPEQD